MSIQADFGLSTSDADRVVTKARTGQLQVVNGAGGAGLIFNIFFIFRLRV
jgi:hypothetical protein